MDQVLHGSARTTPAVRQAIQASTDSLAKLAIRYGLNEKTVAKWRGRTTTQDAPMGPKNPTSNVLIPLEEAAALTFRQHTHLPLDDCLYALPESIPHLSRSALHRLFHRHGIRQLPLAEAPGKALKKQFKAYPRGYFHVDFTEWRLADGKRSLFVAIDRTSKLAFAELHPAATAELAAAFWQRVVQAVPYTIAKVLTDNGVQFTPLPQRRSPVAHRFDAVCATHGIEHRCTQVAHPWTNGQAERFNRTLKEATIQQYHYQDAAELNAHLQTFLQAYNGGKRLKKRHGQTPYEFVWAQFAQNPGIFIRNPTHDLPGLYTSPTPPATPTCWYMPPATSLPAPSPIKASSWSLCRAGPPTTPSSRKRASGTSSTTTPSSRAKPGCATLK